MRNRLLAIFVGLTILPLAASPALAQTLDGRWRGVTSGTPSGGNCRAFTFDIVVRADSVRGSASTPHSGSPVEWKVIGLVNDPRVTLIVESSDSRLRNPSTR